MFDATFVLYLPILTTIVSALFAWQIWKRYQQRGGNHHLWWCAGVIVYGLGTFAEGWMTLFGWSAGMFKFWYVVGALLGGAPLAQGTVWFMVKPRTARWLSVALVAVVAVAAACVIASPIDYSVVDPHVPSGSAFEWQWVRAFSPFINTYAVIFLIGGAIYSAVGWSRTLREGTDNRALARDRMFGNVLIAVGAILPGIGGTATRAGHTEVLYVTEIVGILLIWAGFWLNVRKRQEAPARVRSLRTAGAALLVGAALLLPTAAAAQQPAEGAVLQVRVTDPGGRAAPGVRVELVTAAETGAVAVRRTALSDGHGRAVLELPRGGAWTLRIAEPAFEPIERDIELAEGATTELELELQLAALSEEVSVSATKTTTEVLRVPAAVNVVGREAIELRQARGLDDLLQYEPGVEMAEAPRRLGQTPNIRGFDDQRVLTLQDGARIAQFNSGHRGTLFVDTEDIERVEVIRGPSSALYGAGALGGVVSITSRDPGDMLGGASDLGASLRAGYSDAYGELTLSPRLFGRTDSGFGWMLGYTARRNDGTIELAGERGELRQAEEDVDDFTGRVTAPLSSRDLLRFSLDRFGVDGRTSTNLAVLDVTPSELVDRDTRRTTANLRYSRSGDSWFDHDLSLTTYWSDMQIDELRVADGRDDLIEYRTFGAELRNSVPVGANHRVTYGAEVVSDRQEALRDGGIHAFFPGGNQLLTGVYVQDEIALLDGRVSLIPGLRWDRWASRPDDLELDNQELDRLTPKVGLSVELAREVFATGSYGQGFRAPYFQELFLSDVHFAFPMGRDLFFLALFQPNAELRPEKSRNWDLGLRVRRGPVTARATHWSARVEDFIELLPVRTLPPQQGVILQFWQARNLTDAELDGWEASLDWQASTTLSFRGSYSTSDGVNSATGESLLQVPVSKTILGARWSRPEWGTELLWNASLYGERTDLPEGLAPVDGYVLNDLQASWRPSFRDDVTVFFAVRNLFDVDYEVARFGSPGIGRDVRTGFSVDF